MENRIGKIREAVALMTKSVSFTEDGHTYQNTETEEWLQGISSVSSIVPKNWLAAWGAKEAVKFLGYSDYEDDTSKAKEMMTRITNLIDEKEYIQLLKEAKGACYRKSKTALVDGKTGHKWLEDFVKARINNLHPFATPEDTLKRPIEQFLDWEKGNVKEWILCETIVAYPEKKYAGTLDALALMTNDRIALVDFKFASRISEEAYLQTAGYQACFEPYGIQIDDRIIIRLPKTLQVEQYDKVTRKYSMVDNNLEVHLVRTPYVLDRDTFFHCLPIKKWVNYVLKQGGK